MCCSKKRSNQKEKVSEKSEEFTKQGKGKGGPHRGLGRTEGEGVGVRKRAKCLGNPIFHSVVI